MQYSWANLGETNGKTEWGVKVSGDIGQATGLSGKQVEVQKRDGSMSTVTLGQQRDAWNAGRAAVYAVQRTSRGGKNSGAQQPLEERSEKLYLVRLDVIELDAKTGALVLLSRQSVPISAQDPKLWRETGVDLARCALNEYALLDSDNVPSPEAVAHVAAEAKKPRARPARPSAAPAKKTTTRKKVA